MLILLEENLSLSISTLPIDRKRTEKKLTGKSEPGDFPALKFSGRPEVGVNEQPISPVEALDGEELERFLRTCSHERRSPTTQRTIDAASYAWVHHFIRGWSEGPSSPDWLDLGGANPDQIEGFFSRVALRLHERASGDYASELARYFHDLDRSIRAWPI